MPTAQNAVGRLINARLDKTTQRAYIVPPKATVCEREAVLKASQTALAPWRKPNEDRGAKFGWALHGRRGYLACIRKHGKPPEAFRWQNTRIPKALRVKQGNTIQVQTGNVVENEELT